MKLVFTTILSIIITAMFAEAPAKSVIYIFLSGGPSHTDTFDPKPEAGRDIFGKYKTPIPTNNPDLMINENLSRLAGIADKYSVIRSMTHNSNAHEIGQYVMFTGDMSRSAIVYPAIGAVVSYVKRESYKGALPPYISIPTASTRFNESGFLGAEYKSFSTGGSPESKSFEVEGIISKKVPDKQIARKAEFLNALQEVSSDNICQTEEVKSFMLMQKENLNLILGDAKQVFDISKEDKELRDKYGMSKMGQSCLLARRLVESGTPFVVVNSPAWDTHKEHFKRMDEKLKDLDRAVSSLILDLEEKGLLESTIVIVGGEFGRTPRVDWQPPWNGGRGHFGAAFSYLVAGGGFKGGIVLGSTNETGEKVASRPVYPADFWGSVYYLLGIDPNSKIMHPVLDEVPILPALPKEMESEGIMTELFK